MNPQENWQNATKLNTVRLAYWTTGWLVTSAAAVFGPLHLWQSTAMTLSFIVINFLVGVGMIIANKNYLKGLDELQQKIHLEAMALTLGVGLIGGICYSTLSQTGVIAAKAEISNLVILMSLTYLASLIVLQAKYR